MPDKQTTGSLKYTPLDGKSAEAEDCFDREAFSESVASLISSNRLGNSCVIGICGGWGTGKTWVLETIKEKLELKGDTLCVWFNAWKFENRESLFYPLVKMIGDAGIKILGADSAFKKIWNN